MAFVNTDARYKLNQFMGHWGEFDALVNGVTSIRVGIDRDLPFCTINVETAASLVKRATPLFTTIHSTSMGAFLRASGHPVQFLRRLCVKIQMRQASLKVPVLISEDNKRRDVAISLGADFLTLAKASWDRHNRMLTLYVPPRLLFLCRCSCLGYGCPQPQLVLLIGRPGRNFLSYVNI